MWLTWWLAVKHLGVGAQLVCMFRTKCTNMEVWCVGVSLWHFLTSSFFLTLHTHRAPCMCGLESWHSWPFVALELMFCCWHRDKPISEAGPLGVNAIFLWFNVLTLKKKHCNWRVTVCNTGIHSVSGSTFKRFLPWSCTWHVVQSLGIALEVQALHSFRLYCKICECSCDRFLSRAVNLMPRVKLLSHHFFTQIPTLRLRLIGATLQIMDSNLKDPTAQTVVQSVM